MNAQWDNPRRLQERIIVTGVLVLETPTHLGNGDVEGPLDMPLIADPLEGKALLTGASIAGALRSYLREHSVSLAELLFGRVTNDESVQSSLIVDDALGGEPDTELRDGVAIDPATRTAEARKKFDIELLTAGTEFPLSFELLVRKDHPPEFRQAFALALHGLEAGRISLGKRKRRGFGRCRISRWQVCRYDMTGPHGLIAWLANDRSTQREGTDIATLLGISVSNQYQQSDCVLQGTFLLDGSLLIRSGSGEPDAPDLVHLHSKRNGGEVPVLSGTSLAGALRARAWRIAATLEQDGKAVTDGMFGYRRMKSKDNASLTASRLWVEEAEIENPLERVQKRVKIDRFTGGSYPGALFNEQPVFGQKDTQVRIRVRLTKPTEQDVGLLLLFLKDLWTSDLPIGGESSIGRGRLKGQEALLTYQADSWTFRQGENDTIRVEGDKAKLEQFVQAFVKG